MKMKSFIKRIWYKYRNWCIVSGAMLIAGISYWTFSYERMSYDKIIFSWTISAFITTSILSYFFPKEFFKNALLTTAGFELAIIVRAIYDITFVDPTSHNLIPFELVINGFLAFLPALAGAFIIGMLVRLKENSQEKQ
jgi:hypothetical protein